MSGNIPADIGERMQYIAHKYNDNTIRFVLEYPGLIAPDVLCEATRAVVMSVDVLHASFTAGSWASRWTVHTDIRPADYFMVTECEGDPAETARLIALRPVGHKDKCHLQVTLVRGKARCAVVLRISHLIVDGSDGKYLLGKLAEGCRLAECGDISALRVKNGSRSPTRTYDGLSAKERRTLKSTPFSGVRTNYPFRDPEAHGPRRFLHGTVPAATLGEAAKKAKAVNATVNDLLLTACYRAYARTTGQTGEMSISSMMDLRQHCKNGESEGLANMSGNLPTKLEVVPGRSFSDDLRCVAEETAAEKRKPLAGLYGIPSLHTLIRTLPTELLLWAGDLVYKNMSLSLTNLGNISCEKLTMGGMKPTGGFFGGPLKRKPSLQVGAASFDGAAALTVLGDFADEDILPLQAFLDGIRTEIEAYLREDIGG